MKERNIVLFGESGVGKSSIINMITGTPFAKTSNNVVRRTCQPACYVAKLHSGNEINKINLWETTSLEEGPEETPAADTTGPEPKAFLQQLAGFHDLDLLLFCMRAGKVRNTLVQSYNLVYVESLERKVPVALVVTGLERWEGDMHGWWTKHEERLQEHGLVFDAHACVTTLESHDDPGIQARIDISRCRLRQLAQQPIYIGSSHESICPGLGGVVPTQSVASSGHFTALEGLTRNDTVIAVIGPTGSGKSLFISKATGIAEEDVGIGHALGSCTSQVKAFRFTDPETGAHIVLVDTPGFGHTTLSDSKVLDITCHWIKEMHKRQISLAGMLQFQHIIDFDVVTIVRKTRVLRDIFRDKTPPCAMLVTTMWGDVEEAAREKRLQELRSAYEKIADGNEKIFRYMNTEDSARMAIRQLFENSEGQALSSRTESNPSRHSKQLRTSQEEVGDNGGPHKGPIKSPRNVVLFGESGADMRSIINIVAGHPVATAPGRMLGRPSISNLKPCLVVLESGASMHFWDAVSFQEGVGGTAFEIREKVKTLCQKQLATEGIDLLLYCIPAGRITAHHVEMYNHVYEVACKRTVPVALVLTGLENQEGDMHAWWTRNRDELWNLGLAFDAHACVTTLRSHQNPDVQERIGISQRRLRELVQNPAFVVYSHESICPGVNNEGKGAEGKDNSSITSFTSGRPISFYDITPRDVIIVIVGPTGSGKSLFISKAAEVPETLIGVGHNLRSCTSQVKAFRFTDPRSGFSVVLIDTPGFNHSNKDLPDAKILDMISQWLLEGYKRDIVVAGILHLHRISDRSVATTPKYLRVFRDIYGEKCPRLTLVTTMWNALEEPAAHQNGRLEELTSKYWKELIDGGAKMVRYMNTQESARMVIQQVIEDAENKRDMQVKKEISDLGKELRSTATGEELHDRLEALADRGLKLVRRIREEKKTSTDQHILDDLQKEYDGVQVQIAKGLAEMQGSESPLTKRISQFFALPNLWDSSIVR